MRFVVKPSTDRDGTEYFDVFDTVKDETVAWYTKLDTDSSGLNYGLPAAEEDAAYMNSLSSNEAEFVLKNSAEIIESPMEVL